MQPLHHANAVDGPEGYGMTVGLLSDPCAPCTADFDAVHRPGCLASGVPEIFVVEVDAGDRRTAMCKVGERMGNLLKAGSRAPAARPHRRSALSSTNFLVLIMSDKESSISPADVGSNDPEGERECQERQDEQEHAVEDGNDPRVVADGPLEDSRRSSAWGDGGEYMAAQDREKLSPYESTWPALPIRPGTEMSQGYCFPGFGRVARFDPPMTLQVQHDQLGRHPSIDRVMHHALSPERSSVSRLPVVEEDSESDNDTDDTIRGLVTRAQAPRILRVVNVDADPEPVVNPRELEGRQSPGIGSPTSPIHGHRLPERRGACMPAPESTNGNSGNLTRHNAQKQRTTQLKTTNNNAGRKGSVDSVMSDSSAFEARMARHSKDLPELSSPDSIARIARGVESTADAFRWTRPWKRKLLDEPGVWLCHGCESVLHGAEGALARELLKLKSSVEREPGCYLRQRYGT
ncbi:hypothetical protein TOPH_08379 [Tolypocladium ophioglossoides CBS 100239]|uniref:Uncharacterized protein n=1 Tax=Tolypocladium ophioglossoides (strain CBS 100239) TaxID=1163406 RepID=A0A0L0MYV3_TOLOC|nr:hypothetical protein TOPH_08379 [Tolypocladium ophioglossoides CBS 100239]